MPQKRPPQTSELSLDIHTDSEALLTPKRIRHIDSIQVRNLTPFPVRDAFTSALSQPTNHVQPLAAGVTDDLGVVSPRRRTRKVSSNSTATRSSAKWDDIFPEEEIINPTGGAERGREISGSRISYSEGRSSGHSNSTRTGNSSIPSRSPVIAKPPRPRTNSKASSTSSRLPGSSFSTSNLLTTLPVTNLPLPFLLPNSTQKELENVIGSRLVETCLVIILPDDTHATNIHAQKSPAVNSVSSEPKSKLTPKAARTKSQFGPSPSPRSASFQISSQRSRTSTSSSSSPFKDSAFDIRSVASNHNNLRQSKIANGKSHATSSSTSQPSKALLKRSMTDELSAPSQETNIHQHFSPIHRPSTNPTFTIGFDSNVHSSSWKDHNGQKFRVEIWGAMPIDHSLQTPDNSNEIKSFLFPDKSGFRWRILNEWDVDLQHLIPLPDDLAAHTSQLPSNTLLITLSPPGQIYYLPILLHLHPRPPSPSIGYTSDPESEIRKVKQDTSQSTMTATNSFARDVTHLSRRRRRGGADHLSDSREYAKTASWPDIFQLVTIQACILDNEASLSKIIKNIDVVVVDDVLFPFKRDISEHDSRIAELTSRQQGVRDACTRKRAEMQTRSQKLAERRELLALARQHSRQFFILNEEVHSEVASERAHLATLQLSLNSSRISCLTTLADIFPIDLYSSPDLLFTILDVPLPIPVSNSDPAPPLSLPEHKHVNEEAVSTALGYVAQVLQLLAAYLGKGLVYPVTCVGSRSLIRDGISAMIGPRMFPLFSKGVDTYRFEYGVFLLNKDIEILMVEKDLRALDMRHTLPNLKNLLLTLSHDRDDSRQRPTLKVSGQEGSASSTMGFELPTIDLSTDLSMGTPKPSNCFETSPETHTPTASGTATPTATITDESRRSIPFLVLSPFADFLRGRYPSSGRGSVKGPSFSELQEPSEARDEDDDEDRSTIHGIVRDSGDGQLDDIITDDIAIVSPLGGSDGTPVLKSSFGDHD